MKLAAGEPGARGARVWLDGVELHACCTFADEEAGCVVVIVRDTEGQPLVDAVPCGLLHDDDETPCEACMNGITVREATFFGVVRILLARDYPVAS